MRYILLLSVILLPALSAYDLSFQNSFSGLPASPSESREVSEPAEYSFSSMSEFREYEQTLLKIDDSESSPSSAFSLGILYFTEETAVGGEIVGGDRRKARHYLKRALNGGIYISQFYLAAMDIGEGKHNDAIVGLDMVLSKMSPSINTEYVDANYVPLASLYAATVLDNFNSKVLFQKAITYLFPVAYNYNFSTAQMMLANLYLRLEMMEKANFYLNAACTNPAADSKVLNMCEEFKTQEINKEQ